MCVVWRQDGARWLGMSVGCGWVGVCVCLERGIRFGLVHIVHGQQKLGPKQNVIYLSLNLKFSVLNTFLPFDSCRRRCPRHIGTFLRFCYSRSLLCIRRAECFSYISSINGYMLRNKEKKTKRSFDFLLCTVMIISMGHMGAFLALP